MPRTFISILEKRSNHKCQSWTPHSLWEGNRACGMFLSPKWVDGGILAVRENSNSDQS